jgi:hypothetical protein
MNYLNILLVLFVSGFTAHGQTTISPLTPFDGDTIETKTPLIGWFVMNGNAMANGREAYRLIVVELKDDQSPEAGVTVNVPVLKLDPVQGTQVFYPYDAPELKEGKHYGWQVQRLVNGVVVDKSEAWEFIIPVPEEPVYNKYAMLKKKPDGTFYEAQGGKIFFKMDESYYSESVRVVVYDENNNIVRKPVKGDHETGEHSGELNVKSNGSNFYELDLGDACKAGYYELHAYDAKDQRYILKFRVQ